jgi:dUTP pyrophosphatase
MNRMKQKENKMEEKEINITIPEESTSILNDSGALLHFVETIPGLSEICSLVDLPDEKFKEISVYVNMSVEEGYSSENYKQEIKRLVDSPSFDYPTINKSFTIVLEEVEKLDCIDEKKTFLFTVMKGMIDSITDMYENPYDVLVPTQLLHDNAKLPVYAHSDDSGADIFLTEDLTIPAFSFGYKVATGLACALPRGWQIEVRPRSGKSEKTRIRIANSPGTIDGGYRDEIGILIDNFGEEITFRKGDKLAQIVLQPIYKGRFVLSENVKEIGDDRGGGFGSSDVEINEEN